MERSLFYEDNLPVSLEAVSVKFFPIHFHRDMQIIYVLEGEVNLRLTFGAYNLTPGDIHFVHVNDIHELRGITDDNIVMLLNFNVEVLSAFFPDLYMQVFTTRVSKDYVTYEKKLRLRKNIFRILTEFIEKGEKYKERIFEISNEILRMLYKDFRGFYINKEKKIFEHTVSSDSVQVDRISRVVNFVYDNYPYKLSLDEIAEKEHINKFYLSHLFQKYVGPNFRDFVAMVRIEMSEHQLLDSDMPITRVAQECGFSHPKYYIDHFKSWFGFSPPEYRDKFQKKTINHVKPLVREIALEKILDYGDLGVGGESLSVDSNKEFRLLRIGKANSTESVSWQNLLEVCILPKMSVNSTIKSLYMDFYENIIEQGIKTSVSDTTYSFESIDYIDYKPQDEAVARLANIIFDLKYDRRVKWKTEFPDFTDAKKGLVTSQGLKKPSYYLYLFLSEMYTDIEKIGDNYIISKKDGNLKMLLLNENSEVTLHFDIIPENLIGVYKLRELRLSQKKCFIEFLKQLDYTTDLTLKETETINTMTFPLCRFETVFDITKFVYHCDVEPMEIVQLALTKMEEV